MLNNKYTKIFTLVTYIILISLTTYFIITADDFEGPLQSILILITVIGPAIGLGFGKLTLAFDKWKSSEAAYNIGMFLSKYVAPIVFVIFTVLSVLAVINQNIFYIAYSVPIALIGPFVGIIYDEQL